MSQTTIPFQSATVADEAQAPEPESSQSTRVLLAVGAVGALAVLAVAVYFLLFAGGGDEVAQDAVVPAPKSAVEPQAAAPVTAPEAAQVKVTAKNFGTDPFKPLLVEAEEGTGGAAVTGATTPAAAPASTGTTSTDTTADTSGPAAPATSTPHRFDVVDVSADNKTIDVKLDGETYKGLKAGEIFADIFQVRFIGGSSNSFQIGDEIFNVSGRKAVSISG